MIGTADERSIELRIDELVVETEGERDAAQRLGPVLSEALVLLAQRLGREQSPIARAGMRHHILDRLELELDSVEALTGDRGAERLAELFFQQLLLRLRGGPDHQER